MLDFSFVDPRLLFPNISVAWASAIDSFLMILSIITFALLVIGEWKLFKKFGEKPWKSLIPYYNTYIFYKHTWKKSAFWAFFLTSSVFNGALAGSKFLAQNAPGSSWMTLLILMTLPFGIVATVCSILFAFRIAEAFGKGKLFSVGILLVYSIFIAILGFGKARYVRDDAEDQAKDPAKDMQVEAEVV